MPFFSIETLIGAMQHHPTCMSLMGRGNYDIIDAPQLTREHFKAMNLNLSGGDKIPRNLWWHLKIKQESRFDWVTA